MQASAAPRRVLIVGSDRHDTMGDSYRRALAEHYEVLLVNPDTPFGARFWGRKNPTRFDAAVQLMSRAVLRDEYALTLPRLVEATRRFDPDLILITPIASIPPATIAQMRACAKRAKVFGMFADPISNFDRGYFFNADYDALFFKDHFIVDKFRAKLAWRHVHYLPQACDPVLHRPVEVTDEHRRKYGCDLTIAGNVHAFRVAALAALEGRDLRIWGAPPPVWLKHPILRHHQKRPVIGEEKSIAMRAAKIVLNQNYYAEIAGTNKRTFEVAAMGAFQLTDTPALADVFVPGTEVASFDDHKDMLEKIDHYLARPELRAEMAERAMRRAHAEHTYAHRWTAKMRVLGVPVPATFPVQLDDVRISAM